MRRLASVAVVGVAGILAAALRRALCADSATAVESEGDRAPLPAEATRAELYEEAKRLAIPGRSRMNKAELRVAIQESRVR